MSHFCVCVWVCVRMCVCGGRRRGCCWLPAVRKLSSDEDTLKHFRWELMWKHSDTHSHTNSLNHLIRVQTGRSWDVTDNRSAVLMFFFFSRPSHVESELKVSFSCWSTLRTKPSRVWVEKGEDVSTNSMKYFHKQLLILQVKVILLQ